MITLQRPDPKVSALMGENKGIQNGVTIRPSVFAIPIVLGDKKMVLNTFTDQCIETKRFAWFDNPCELRYDETDNEMKDLVSSDYLVACDFDERKKYMEILSLLRRIEEPKLGYIGYTILPTTCCNARCIYCYEKGMQYETMSDEIVEQTIRYIKTTRKKDALISFRWFGGEPLMGEKIIDRICWAMREADINYSSSMVSNGSLMTEELAAKAKEEWNLKSIQITLDGREEVYCDRKRYIAFNGSPYRAVLNGIHALSEQNIRVSIRLNVDEENLEELMNLVDDLEQEYENDNTISIYCHSIFVESDDEFVRDNDELYNGMEKLNCRLEEFNRKRRERSHKEEEILQESTSDVDLRRESDDVCSGDRNYYDRRGNMKRYYCMVDNPPSGPVILPNGELNLCEHIGEVPVVGTVYDKSFMNREAFVERDRVKKEKCRHCGLLPVCTDFTSCPCVSRDCYRENLAVIKNKLRQLENENRLPPVNVQVNGIIVRVKEPTPDFIEMNSNRIVPSYIKVEKTIDCREAGELIENDESIGG